jgi:hypothetical protein
MPDPVCERCGAAAVVSVVTVDSNRRRVRPIPIEHSFCSACALAFSEALRTSHDAEGLALEPERLSWSDVERQLAEYADTIEHEPYLRDQVMRSAHLLLQAARQVEGPMPILVEAAFARLGFSPSFIHFGR